MKLFKLLYIFILLASTSVFSQYSNYNRNGGGGGVNRDIAKDLYTRKEPSAEDIEKNKAERVEKFMQKLKTDLNLDDLQYIAIKNEVTANNRNIEIVMKKETSQEEKSKEMKVLMEKTEQIVNSYLNKEQKEKFKTFAEDKNYKNKKGKKEEKVEDKPIPTEQ